MAYKVFLDINVLIDFFDPNRLDNLIATKVFRLIEKREIIAYTSESVICTTLYLMGKNYSSDTLKILATELLSNFEILPCNNTLFLESLNLGFKDIEDAVIYNLALRNNIDYFITNDKVALKKLATKKLPIVSTKNFLRFIKF